jgi:hypothetical protein
MKKIQIKRGKQNGQRLVRDLGNSEDCIGRQGPQWTVALDDDDDDDDDNNNNNNEHVSN